MAKVNGRTALALPQSLQDGLTSLGYVAMEVGRDEAPFYRMPKFPALFFTGTTSAIPGAETVIAQWHGQKVIRVPIDTALSLLRLQLDDARSPIQKMSAAPARFGGRR